MSGRAVIPAAPGWTLCTAVDGTERTLGEPVVGFVVDPETGRGEALVRGRGGTVQPVSDLPGGGERFLVFGESER